MIYDIWAILLLISWGLLAYSGAWDKSNIVSLAVGFILGVLVYGGRK